MPGRMSSRCRHAPCDHRPRATFPRSLAQTQLIKRIDEQLRELGYAQVLPPNSSGIHILIVGCGFAGLACAIESVRKGHTVTLLEKYDHIRTLGDVISFDFNVGRFFMRWGLHEQLHPLCAHASHLHLHNAAGALLHVQPLPQAQYASYMYNGHRGELLAVLAEYARELGVDIRLAHRVVDFWEDAAAGEAGVVLEGGARMAADVVVAADGTRSAARRRVLGYDDKPMASGYAIYRTWFDAGPAGIDKDPLTSFLAQETDVLYGWIGHDAHFLASNCKKGTTVSCVLTHKDTADIAESWSHPGRREDVLALVADWDPRCAALVRKAPAFVDWKLVHRAPLPTWLAPGARLALVGDAAHPFLPTSVQGAAQAVEDGVALATALHLAGKPQIPLALRTWEHLRYARVCAAQRLGQTTRDTWHGAGPDARGPALDLPRPPWLLDFDAERDACARFAGVAARLVRVGYRPPGDAGGGRTL